MTHGTAGRMYDVMIIGAGMVGAATACLLGRAGFSVALVESREPVVFNPEAPAGLRVSALSPGSENILTEAGAWRQIAQNRCCAYRKMRVEDRDAGAAWSATAAEFGLERLGTIVENDLVQWSLWHCLENLGGVDLFCPAEIGALDVFADKPMLQLLDGRELSARLLVGADGAHSRVRHAMGVEQQVWTYGQRGIVAVVKTATDNPGLAWQRFLPGGPLAFLPLAPESSDSSSIVWSQPDEDARRLLALEPDAFCAELTAAAGNEAGDDAGTGSGADFPGTVVSCGPRASFPLNMQLSSTYTTGRAVLIGDAAHVLHPLAGQGVNLGFLDAAALTEALLNARKAGLDIGSTRTLQRFARWRRSETELMARGIDGIRTLFEPEWLQPMRRIGINVLSRSWTLQEAFIRRAAGHNRNAPALSRGVRLSELMQYPG